jgi:pterin-4a-carbinolamine dehydratase
MPPELLTVIFGAIQVIIVGLVVALRASDKERLVKLEQWTHDKEKFDYEFRHEEYARAIADINKVIWPTATKVEQLEASEKDLRGWKHAVVDAYLPRAVDEHERRLNRIESKLFNGGPK